MRRLLSVLVVLAACDSSPSGTDAPAIVAGADTTVTALDGAYVHFGDPNTRTIDTPVTFPAPGLRYRKVTLRLGLRCPTGGCDFWDRLGHLSILQPAPGGGDPVELEVARFITPYRVGAQLTLDVTDLQRVLEGAQTLRVFIDTWVGPGHPQGAGWLVDATFDFEGGLPSPDPFAVVPLWAPQRLVYGDPAHPIDVHTTLDVPAGATSVALRAFVTGHGQGNAANCAEFCARDHTFHVGTQQMTTSLWRDDCTTTAAPNQQGTWQYARAGWCPGAIVRPWSSTFAATPGPLAISYAPSDYENTCRPDAPTCTGCTLGSTCAYDGGAHTEPGWEQSAVLVLYR